jgi:hypothetical protein
MTTQNRTPNQHQTKEALLELYQELRSGEQGREMDFKSLHRLDATIEAIENGAACPLPQRLDILSEIV